MISAKHFNSNFKKITKKRTEIKKKEKKKREFISLSDIF